MITEVRSDYYCDDERCTYIDVWVANKEEGFSVARVFDHPRIRVECQPGKENYFADPLVQEEIVLVLEEYFEEKFGLAR